jgi:hypothetical protein
MEPMTVHKSILAIAILGILLTGCSRQASAETLEFCNSYVSTGKVASNGPGEDARAWAEEITGSLTALTEIVPEKIEGSFDVISGAALTALGSHDSETFHEAAGSRALAKASATIDRYVETECGLPGSPPSPGYRDDWPLRDLGHALLSEPTVVGAFS